MGERRESVAEAVAALRLGIDSAAVGYRLPRDVEHTLHHLADRIEAANRWSFEIKQGGGEPATCQVRYQGRLVFDGVDRSVLIRRPL